MLSVIMFIVIMFNVIMLSVIMLSVIIIECRGTFKMLYNLSRHPLCYKMTKTNYDYFPKF
jgi:hypothetical protein